MNIKGIRVYWKPVQKCILRVVIVFTMFGIYKLFFLNSDNEGNLLLSLGATKDITSKRSKENVTGNIAVQKTSETYIKSEKATYFECNKIYCGANKTISYMFNTAENVAEAKGFVKRFPKGICIGLPKAGTTALLFFLRKHPNIVAHPGEPNFFTFSTLYGQGLQAYLRLMPKSYPHQLTFEKSPLYGVPKQNRTVLERIYQYDPDIKLLYMVRNPISKAMSAFQNFFVRAGKTGRKSFEVGSVQFNVTWFA